METSAAVFDEVTGELEDLSDSPIHEPDDEDDVDDEEPAPVRQPNPPRRNHAASTKAGWKPAHRKNESKPVQLGQPAPWERPREGFTSAMTSRSAEMSATRESRFVSGRTKEF